MFLLKIIKRLKILLIITLFLFITQIPISGHSESEIINENFNWIKNSLGDNYLEDTAKLFQLQENIYLYIIENNEGITSYVISNHNKDENILQIIEYGFGSNSPYQKTIIANENITNKDFHQTDEFYYYNPLESYWLLSNNNEKYYIDGSTGDLILDIVDFKEIDNKSNYFYSNEKIKTEYLSDELIFDPYYNLNWLFPNEDNESLTKEEITKSLLTEQEIIYSGQKFNEKIKFAYPVIGFQATENLLYLAIYDSDLNLTRYINSTFLQLYGDFSF